MPRSSRQTRHPPAGARPTPLPPPHLLSRLLLGVVVIVDNRAVLGPHIPTLAVEGGGVHMLEEAVQQLGVRRGAVVVDLHGLSMPCAPRAHRLVAGGGHLTPCVPGAGVGHPRDALEGQLQAPEAAAWGRGGKGESSSTSFARQAQPLWQPQHAQDGHRSIK
ncbi:hypothetical protein F751_1223 [Auxenochlorella protothecoides]|uniref:Uncharacterized protein n=1 Tax=Auxenochlorella protothecoides TaxID=3075 RepID=A0A087SNZ2_AUXPR|nr:hypothetical protein F751_1223 [Auxenochlorella protothecoides]KFM27446.1 hypothetical protein F751_1223 [Auxenochlorella protothecoides]